jgi:hypothetical protein
MFCSDARLYVLGLKTGILLPHGTASCGSEQTGHIPPAIGQVDGGRSIQGATALVLSV